MFSDVVVCPVAGYAWLWRWQDPLEQMWKGPSYYKM